MFSRSSIMLKPSPSKSIQHTFGPWETLHHFNESFVLPFDNDVLLRHVRHRSLLRDTILRQGALKCLAHEFSSIIVS